MIIWQQKVKDFHEKYNCPVETKPTLISEKDRLRRARLIVSESAEFVEEADKNNLVGMCDALCDIIFVCLGTAVEMGVDLEPLFDEVCRSNMTKTPRKDAGGKILKGDDFVEPNLEQHIVAQGWK